MCLIFLSYAEISGLANTFLTFVHLSSLTLAEARGRCTFGFKMMAVSPVDVDAAALCKALVERGSMLCSRSLYHAALDPLG